MTRDVDERVRAAVVGLGRALRAAGLGTSVGEEALFCRSLAEVGLERTRAYWAGRAAFVRGPEQIAPFDRVFERFWAGLPLERVNAVAEHGETDPRMPGPQHGGASLPQFRFAGGSMTLLDGGAVRASVELNARGGAPRSGGERRGVLSAFSPDEFVGERSRLEYAQDELAAVRRLTEALRDAVPERRSRRLRPSRRRGSIDLRRTVARSLRTGGEPVTPAHCSQSRRPRRLLVLCDVSGSMDRYSRVLLATLKGAVAADRKTEAFVFATRLTRVTRALSRNDAEALLRARESVADWSGGTRIGQVLSDFNRAYGRRGLARGAIVLLVSDGWDRGNPEQLARELERIRRQSRRLVWISPRPVDIERDPLAVGLRAALPHIDDLVASLDRRLLVDLPQLLGMLGDRPARRRASGARLDLAADR